MPLGQPLRSHPQPTPSSSSPAPASTHDPFSAHSVRSTHLRQQLLLSQAAHLQRHHAHCPTHHSLTHAPSAPSWNPPRGGSPTRGSSPPRGLSMTSLVKPSQGPFPHVIDNSNNGTASHLGSNGSLQDAFCLEIRPWAASPPDTLGNDVRRAGHSGNSSEGSTAAQCGSPRSAPFPRSAASCVTLPVGHGPPVLDPALQVQRHKQPASLGSIGGRCQHAVSMPDNVQSRGSCGASFQSSLGHAKRTASLPPTSETRADRPHFRLPRHPSNHGRNPTSSCSDVSTSFCPSARCAALSYLLDLAADVSAGSGGGNVRYLPPFLHAFDQELQRLRAFVSATFDRMWHQLEHIAEASQVLLSQVNAVAVGLADVHDLSPALAYVRMHADELGAMLVGLDAFVGSNAAEMGSLAATHDWPATDGLPGRPAGGWAGETVAVYVKCVQDLFMGGNRLEHLIIGLSDVYAAVRHLEASTSAAHSKSTGQDKGKAWQPPDAFKRTTTKYWVHPAHVLRVKALILRHLPLLIFGRAHSVVDASNGQEGGGAVAAVQQLRSLKGVTDSGSISSVYYDNASLFVYHSRLVRGDKAQLVRIRWYGERPKGDDDSLFVERKIHRDAWTGEASIKERAPLPQRYVHALVNGGPLPLRPVAAADKSDISSTPPQRTSQEASNAMQLGLKGQPFGSQPAAVEGQPRSAVAPNIGAAASSDGSAAPSTHPISHLPDPTTGICSGAAQPVITSSSCSRGLRPFFFPGVGSKNAAQVAAVAVPASSHPLASGCGGRAAADVQPPLDRKSQLLLEVQAFLTQHRQAPFMRTEYSRCAFQESSNNDVRVSLDTHVTMLREIGGIAAAAAATAAAAAAVARHAQSDSGSDATSAGLTPSPSVDEMARAAEVEASAASATAAQHRATPGKATPPGSESPCMESKSTAAALAAAAGGGDIGPHAEEWCRAGGAEGVSHNDLVPFPYAILEIKLADEEKCPAWVLELRSSGLLVECAKFSKFLHGMALLYPFALEHTPPWFTPDGSGHMRPANLEEMGDDGDLLQAGSGAWVFPTYEGEDPERPHRSNVASTPPYPSYPSSAATAATSALYKHLPASEQLFGQPITSNGRLQQLQAHSSLSCAAAASAAVTGLGGAVTGTGGPIARASEQPPLLLVQHCEVGVGSSGTVTRQLSAPTHHTLQPGGCSSGNEQSYDSADGPVKRFTKSSNVKVERQQQELNGVAMPNSASTNTIAPSASSPLALQAGGLAASGLINSGSSSGGGHVSHLANGNTGDGSVVLRNNWAASGGNGSLKVRGGSTGQLEQLHLNGRLASSPSSTSWQGIRARVASLLRLHQHDEAAGDEEQGGLTATSSPSSNAKAWRSDPHKNGQIQDPKTSPLAAASGSGAYNELASISTQLGPGQSTMYEQLPSPFCSKQGVAGAAADTAAGDGCDTNSGKNSPFGLFTWPPPAQMLTGLYGVDAKQSRLQQQQQQNKPQLGTAANHPSFPSPQRYGGSGPGSGSVLPPSHPQPPVALPAPDAPLPLPTAAALVRTRVEPKTFFAAERTFLSWINVAVLLMFASLSLAATGGGYFNHSGAGVPAGPSLSVYGSTSGKNGMTASASSTPAADAVGGCHGGICRSSQLAGMVLAPVALLLILYALYVYRARSNQIARRETVRFDDQRGPIILTIVLVAVLLVSYILTAAPIR